LSNQNIIRAWKDATFRNTLSSAELAALPANPAGVIEITDQDLGKIAGGMRGRVECWRGGP
jgi:mersacidin/lichenicidin family type 2 lantibiotic